MMADALRKEGHEVIQSFEPTNGTWGSKLRESATTGRLSIEEELDYFIRDRREHVEQVITPTIHGGGIVILDRYYFSTMAYQGARGIDPTEIRIKMKPSHHVRISSSFSTYPSTSPSNALA